MNVIGMNSRPKLKRKACDGVANPIIEARKELPEEQEGKPRPAFFFIGSAVSAMGNSNLPAWDDFVNGLMTGLGQCAGLEKRDLQILEDIDKHRETIKKEITKSLNDSSNRYTKARPSYLENYHLTDILCRRLGRGYLKVLEAFQGAQSNAHHEELINHILDKSKRAMGIVTTNFDTCIDAYLDQLLNKGDIHLCRMSGDLDKDVARLEKAGTTGPPAKPIVILCQSFRSFDLVASLMCHIVDDDSPFRFVFNIHGTADDTATCVDSNFQREQRLPYGVSHALYVLYVKCQFIVAGYSGLDINENSDYLRMLSNWDHIAAVWLCQKLIPEEKNNSPPALLRQKIRKRKQNAGWKEEGESIRFVAADLRLPKENYKSKDAVRINFRDTLNASIAGACSYEPVWAALALQDLLRALSIELNRDVLQDKRATWMQSKCKVTALASVDSDFKKLRSGLARRLESLTAKFPSGPSSSGDGVRRAWTEGWLIRNVESPSEIRNLDKLVEGLIGLFHRIKRKLEPLDEHRKNLNALAETMENMPERFADAWVVWATYIMLNYHDPKRRTLCWSYYLKAVRSALYTGNIWGKMALNDLRDTVWTDMDWDKFETCDDRSSLRFHRQPLCLTSAQVEAQVKSLSVKIGSFCMGGIGESKCDAILEGLHVLGIDPELPVHHIAGIPLAEHYRVLLIITLTYSRLALIRDSAGRGNYTFLRNTLREAERKLDLFPAARRERRESTRLHARAEKTSLVDEDNDTIDSPAAISVQSCIWVVEENDSGLAKELLRTEMTEIATEIGTRLRKETTPKHQTNDTIKLMEAMGRLVNDTIEKSLARELLANFMINAHKSETNNECKEKYLEYIDDVMLQLHRFTTNFQKCKGDIHWSRDLLYDVFHLNSVKVVDVDAENATKLRENVGEWIKDTYKKKPWRYMDILQLLISAPFALNSPVQTALCEKNKFGSVLVLTEYETHLYLLGLLAHTTENQRSSLNFTIQPLSGSWYDYQRFSLADIANLRKSESVSDSSATGESEVMERLKEKQFKAYNDSFDSELNDSLLHAQTTSIYSTSSESSNAQEWLERRCKTVERLADEFVVCSNRPLPAVYTAPDLRGCIYTLQARS